MARNSRKIDRRDQGHCADCGHEEGASGEEHPHSVLWRRRSGWPQQCARAWRRLKYDQQGGAPVYQYFFTWQSPMLDGDAGAWHTAELAFCFDNTKRCEQGTGNTPEAQALAKKMATAWANFARTGNPSQPGLTWTPADPTRGQTMVWDNTSRMVDDPEGDVRKILLS